VTILPPVVSFRRFLENIDHARCDRHAIELRDGSI